MWLAIYFPSLLVPQNSSDITVVYHSAQNKIVQCNNAALKVGIELGMGLGSACALSAHVNLIPYCNAQERLLLTRILYALYTFNSDICVESSNEILIRCDRHNYYYGGQDVQLRILLAELHKQDFPFYFATANTPEQALVLAKARSNTVFTAEQVLIALHVLPITQLPLDTKIQQQLQRVGIRTIKQLFSLPMEDLAGRFPQPFIKYLYALKGLHKVGRTFYQPPEYFNESIELPFDMDSQDFLVRWASSLLTLLQQYLRSRNQVTQILELVLTDSEKQKVPLVLRSGSAKYRIDDWLPILTLTLEKTLLVRPIRSMQLRCEETHQATTNTNDLFVDKRASIVDAHKLFDVLQTRLGEQVFHPPKSQFCVLSRQWPVTAATPAFIKSTPSQLTTNGNIIAGPQRIQTQWWHTPLKRDYFLLETNQAQRYWVFREKAQNSAASNTSLYWYNHGWFC